jgi:hypothetical protein
MKTMFKSTLIIGCLAAAAAVAHAQGHVPSANVDRSSDPGAQALKLYLAIQKQDWRSMYLLTLFSEKVRNEMPDDPDAFATGVRAGINGEKDGQKTLDDLLNNLSEIEVAEPVISGDKADVPTSAKLTLNGRMVPFKGVAHMIRYKDVWKWDLSFSDDTRTATEQALLALIGKPQ